MPDDRPLDTEDSFSSRQESVFVINVVWNQGDQPDPYPDLIIHNGRGCAVCASSVVPGAVPPERPDSTTRD